MATETVGTPARRSRLSGLALALALAFTLLMLSFVRIVGEAATAALGGPVINTVLAEPMWKTTLGRNVTLFAAALLFIHGLFGVGCWGLALLSERAFPSARTTHRQWILAWSLGTAVWVLMANAAWFPHSSLGEPYADLVRASWRDIEAFQLVSVVLLTAIGCVTGLAAVRFAQMPSRRLPLVVIVATLVTGWFLLHRPSEALPASSRPNVIIIGLDALRPELARANDPQALAPHVAAFLAQSVSFGDAITPLARTFPSWVSILTGRNPHTTGAVINLLPRDLIHTGGTIGDMFRKAGYRTIYSIDNVQFSNIDQSYGFDETITPPIGATEFVLAWFGDTPLSNLLVNTRIGAALFSYLYANRGAAVTYEPATFIDRLDRELSFDRPTFLAVHLTLSHWPYFWADSPGKVDRFGDGDAQYPTAVRAIDRQFEQLVDVLRRHGALSHAIVVVLSDHGEALGKPDDLLDDDTGGLESPLGEYQRWGHGTSVLSPHQYRVVLALRSFGIDRGELARGMIISTPVSLEDLAPTLSDMFGLHADAPFDGRSLMPLVHDAASAASVFSTRIRFTESEFNPGGVSVAKVSNSAIQAAALYYRVDPLTDRVELRRELLRDVVRNRQYAALQGDRMLAAIPTTSGRNSQDYQLVWTDGANTQNLHAVSAADMDPELCSLRDAISSRFNISLDQFRPAISRPGPPVSGCDAECQARAARRRDGAPKPAE